MPDIADAALLADFRSGDERALEALFARYESPLFRFLLTLLRDHHQAEDLVQETFVRALERLDTVAENHLRGWLFTVAYHKAMLVRRRKKGRLTGSLDAALALTDRQPPPERQAERKEDVCRLRRLVERLPRAQREVIRQRVYEGKRFREIAADLHCPLNTALARMHEGMKRLRRWFDPCSESYK